MKDSAPRESDSLITVSPNAAAAAAAGSGSTESDAENRRSKRSTYGSLFVLLFVAVALLIASLMMLQPSATESISTGTDTVTASTTTGTMRASKTKNKHASASKTTVKADKYNDAFSTIADDGNIVHLDAESAKDGEDTPTTAEVDVSSIVSSTSTANADTDLVLGKSHKTKRCEDGGYSKRTLKRAYEMPFAALFQDNRGQKKFEASDVIIVNETFAYAVCDSLWSISEFNIGLPPFSPLNRQIGDPDRDPDDESGYEAIFHDDGNFYVIRESVLHHNVRRHVTDERKKSSYHGIVEQLAFTDDGDYNVVEECRCQFQFEGDSKGFEGAIAVHDLDGKLTILGLCEGNHCSEEHKKDKGNGVLIAMQKVDHKEEGCLWETVRRISLPSSVSFTDYSAISIDANDRIAITSQEDSQLYVGKMIGKDEATGYWDIDAIDFETKKEKIFDFPKNDDCETMYCNIEGIHWLDDNMLIAVSDKMKSKGKQDYRCFGKDQSVHAFVLP